jgi:hypothetical protein
MTAPTFEPELAQPTPRRIAAREGCVLGCLLWAGRLLALPHTLAGLYLIYQAAKATVLYFGVLWAGVEVEGRVTGKAEHTTRKGTVYYTVDYVFPVDGFEHAWQFQPDADRYAAIREGQPIAVRAWPAAPRDGHWVDGRGGPSGLSAGPAWFAALFWNGIVSLLVWYLYVRPYRQRQLIRYGVPTTGIVREVAVADSRSTDRFTVRYEYAVPAGHRTLRGKATALQHLGAAELTPGDVLTVLYDPRRPRRSLAYRFSDYQAVPPVTRAPTA